MKSRIAKDRRRRKSGGRTHQRTDPAAHQQVMGTSASCTPIIMRMVRARKSSTRSKNGKAGTR
jgi:hypothetical protein